MIAPLLQKLALRRDLTTSEAAAAMAEVMAGRATPATIAALLMGLLMKGERPEEIVGFARTMRAEAIPFETGGALVFDTCGTGGDGAGTFNISTAAALVAAGAGIRRPSGR